MPAHRVETEISGRRLSIETGKLAKQADGAAVVRYGDTVVLGTVVLSREPRQDCGYLPLFVEYREMTYAAGRIPGGFFKREGRPTEKETLSARLIDRPLRPFFPDGWFNEVQVIVNVLSADQENDPDVLGIIAASSAIAVSDIPFPSQVGAVRVGRVSGEYRVFPTHSELNDSDIDLVVATADGKPVMIESGAKEAGNSDILKALQAGIDSSAQVCRLIGEIAGKAGKEKRRVKLFLPEESLLAKVKELSSDKMKKVLDIPDKDQRETFMDELFAEVHKAVGEETFPAADVKYTLGIAERDLVRDRILGGKRTDDRDGNELREVSCETGVLPRTHGSAVFTRGQTQALAVATLGTSDDEQRQEGLTGESSKTFMLHYNFPPFSVGEVKPMRGPSRRDIGHGVLAEKALRPVLPSGEEFPYTIRIVSEILESNGSSSMATVCSACLALMDAGVAIKKPVAGIAMGLVKNGGAEILLSDIMGLEDHFGDMDFKVAGTEDGITAIQMDLKITGIGMELIEKVLEQAAQGRMKILEVMKGTLPGPRASLSAYAPRIKILNVNTEKIGALIGPAGKVIKSIIAKTGAEINIENDGKVFVFSNDEARMQEAIDMIQSITAVPEVGKTYNGKVVKILDFGAFVEIFPGQDGLVHISELANYRVKKVDDVVKMDDELKVKVIAVDNTGRVSLSRKALLGPEAEGESKEPGQ